LTNKNRILHKNMLSLNAKVHAHANRSSRPVTLMRMKNSYRELHKLNIYISLH